MVTGVTPIREIFYQGCQQILLDGTCPTTLEVILWSKISGFSYQMHFIIKMLINPRSGSIRCYLMYISNAVAFLMTHLFCFTMQSKFPRIPSLETTTLGIMPPYAT